MNINKLSIVILCYNNQSVDNLNSLRGKNK